MASVFLPGERVDTHMGRGMVSSTIGLRVIVQLENSRIPVEFSESELAERNGKSIFPTSPTAAQLTPTGSSAIPVTPPTRTSANPASVTDLEPKVLVKTLDPALRAIEALRFGLVPASMIDQLTIGFEEIERWTNAQLPHNNGDVATVSEVYGPFGSGKSHTMEAIRWIARKQGYVTARIEVDGWTVTLSDPAGFLSVLWPTLAADDLHSETPLLDLYLKAIAKGSRAPSVAPAGRDRVYANYNMILKLHRLNLLDNYNVDMEAVLNCSPDITAAQLANTLRGERSLFRGDVKLLSIIGRSVDDRPYDFVEALIGTAIVAKMAGYRGLVISVDEFEVEHMGQQWSRLQAVIKVLARYLAGDLSHPDAPLALFFATVGQDGHAGDAVLDPLLSVGSKPFECRQLREQDLHELGRRLIKFYSDSYGFKNSSESDLEVILNGVAKAFYENPSLWSSSGLTRAWAKFLLQFMDKLMGPPHG